MSEYLNRADLLNFLDEVEVNHLLRASYWTGHGNQPIAESDWMADQLGLMREDGGAK